MNSVINWLIIVALPGSRIGGGRHESKAWVECGFWALGYVGRQVAPKSRIIMMVAILNYSGLEILYKLF